MPRLRAGLFFGLLSATTWAAIQPLTAADCADLLDNGVLSAANPVPCERLQRVSFSHLDLQGQLSTGQLIVLDAVAPQVAALMLALRAAKFPLQSALPLTQFKGNDVLSMNANNSSALNGRAVTAGQNWSKHAYGVAIDVNPLQNPYVSFADDGTALILPAASAKAFLNRAEFRAGKPRRSGMVNEAVAHLFAQYGFMTWGGDWDSPIDYQHFEIGSRAFIEQLITLDPAAAQASFQQYADRYRQCAASETGSLSEIRAVCVAKVRQ
ncbi:M15 family metallopeptidase [Deefgea piscis]|uniref:M15 family metallopeptidase n=1 Tax=Deefgea piscis TaxID=2739061 RepID=UPI001C80C9DC|nr:M15 family metallopeptidase [Deefgea piscis]QZA82136.1 M15 family metallopeptidase [Deefgea piscis]